MTYKREDDMVNENGEPISPAHKAIYDHLDQCKNELMAHHDMTLDKFERRHVTERHHEPMSDYLANVDLTPQDLVESAVQMHEIVPGLADFVYGPPKIDPATGDIMVDAKGRPFRQTEKGAQHAVNNGGFRASIPRWLVTLLAALIGAMGLIGAAVIQHSNDTQTIVERVVEELQQLQEDVTEGAPGG